ncbi:flagellar hook-associated protein FlgL [Acidocella sp.]|uniref:flagellar hook-associated protein FlgL n=1 Tax=Acidocella sp. TaxID=50710 RepID=UPI00260B94D2|nr:flagellar hook-associated protein FlgL [Acidocella sp.]
MNLAFYSNFSAALTQGEAQLGRVQQQIASGLTVQTPDQGAAAYQTATAANDRISALSTDTTNQATVSAQLGAADNAYSAVSSLFDNVQAVVEQALNGTTNSQNMNTLANQITSAGQQLLGLANSKGTSGAYLFGGTTGGLTPFQKNASGTIAYYGDGGSSYAQVGEGQVVPTVGNGEVFMAGMMGDGFSSVTANTANTGTGQILQQGVVNLAQASAFQSGNASVAVTFGANGSYVETQGGATLASSTVTQNAAGAGTIQISGMSFQVTGSPAAGDSFTISPSRPQTAFSLLQQIAGALQGAASTPAQVAQTKQVLNQSLATLSQYQQAVTTAQAQNGIALNAINNISAGNTNQSTALQTAVTNATAVNTPVAISQLDQTLTSLQAAMKAFGTVQNLSLFNYL